MSRKSLLGVMVVFFLVSVAAAFIAVPKQPEGLYSSPAIADLGELAQDQRITTEFTIKNGFSKAVTIEAIRKSCSCIEAELHKTLLNPGEDARLKATLATGRARGKISLDMTVFFHPEGGQREWITLPMNACVVPEIDCEPAVLLFRAGKGDTKAVKLSSTRGQDFQVKRAYCNHAAFEARLLQDRNRIEVTFDAARRHPDVRDAHLVIDTSSATEPTISIPLRVKQED